MIFMSAVRVSLKTYTFEHTRGSFVTSEEPDLKSYCLYPGSNPDVQISFNCYWNPWTGGKIDWYWRNKWLNSTATRSPIWWQIRLEERLSCYWNLKAKTLKGKWKQLTNHEEDVQFRSYFVDTVYLIRILLNILSKLLSDFT